MKWSANPVVDTMIRRRSTSSVSPIKLHPTEGTALLPRSVRPETYVQFGGKAILEQFGRRLPALLILPERIPDDVLSALLYDPFRHIVRHVSNCL